MITWLAHRLPVPIKSSIITFLSTESKSFNLADLSRIMFLSNKRRIECCDSDTVEKHHIKLFLGKYYTFYLFITQYYHI